MAKATPPAASDTADPVATVDMILNAEGPAPRDAMPIPTVMAQSKKLSEMMDGLTDLSDFGAIRKDIDEEMVKIATVGTEEERKKGTDPEPVKLPPFRPVEGPRAAAPKAPKEAPVHEYEARTPGRRRGAKSQATPANPTTLPTGGAGPSTTALTGEHVASLLKMTHAIGATVLGPSFAIPDESARAIGDAALPVLEDFGVAMASRAVHLMMLVSTVAMIEGPILLTVFNDMKTRAQINRTGLSAMAMGGSAGPHNQYQDDEAIARAISMATGVQVGNAV